MCKILKISVLYLYLFLLYVLSAQMPIVSIKSDRKFRGNQMRGHDWGRICFNRWPTLNASWNCSLELVASWLAIRVPAFPAVKNAQAQSLLGLLRKVHCGCGKNHGNQAHAINQPAAVAVSAVASSCQLAQVCYLPLSSYVPRKIKNRQGVKEGGRRGWVEVNHPVNDHCTVGSKGWV